MHSWLEILWNIAIFGNISQIFGNISQIFGNISQIFGNDSHIFGIFGNTFQILGICCNPTEQSAIECTVDWKYCQTLE